MTDIIVRFDLSFSRRFLTSAGAAAMVLCAVPELDSEAVTLSTYYPAPSGVYTQMIATGNAFLSRDGGGLAVGTSVAPTGSTKMVVMGGNVGIGTGAPASVLSVAGGVQLGDDAVACTPRRGPSGGTQGRLRSVMEPDGEQWAAAGGWGWGKPGIVIIGEWARITRQSTRT